jgi:hypothetical protein
VTNTFSFTRSTTGRTSGPDLRFLIFDPAAPAVTATFTFDEPLAGQAEPSAFHLYRRSGREWDAQSCELMSSESDQTQVGCTFPIDTSTFSRAIPFLGAVDGGAVLDALGRANPEGTDTGYYASCATAPYQHQCG